MNKHMKGDVLNNLYNRVNNLNKNKEKNKCLK